MKSLKSVFASALLFFSVSAFAGTGGNETCTSCLGPDAATSIEMEGIATADAGVEGMLLEMTQHAHDRIRSEGASVLVNQMTRTVRQSISTEAVTTVF